jgi:hypothetical protein
MQEKPNKEELLAAISAFLMAELKPVITDARLSFRVLIAANLAQIVANELQKGPLKDAAELARLKQLLPDLSSNDLRVLEGELAARLRDGRVDLKAARAHLRETLRDQLAVNNPFFDTRAEIES